MKNKFHVYSCSLVVVLLGVSLYLPALRRNLPSSESDAGYMAVILGLFALAVPCPAVLANPALLLGAFFLFTKRWKRAAIVGGCAVLLASSSFLMYDPTAPPPPPLRNHMSLGSPRDQKVTQFEVGFYCWWASTVLLAAAGIAGHLALSQDDLNNKRLSSRGR